MNRSATGPSAGTTDHRSLACGQTSAGPSYADLMRVDDLIALLPPPSDLHDEPVFYAAHMVYELWFKVILDELERARDSIDSDDVPRALHCLRRVHAIERVLIDQVDILETILPGGFALLRPTLHQASGFQSAQFREIEFLSGRKDPHHLHRTDLTASGRARLERRLAEPTLADAFREFRTRRGDPDLVELLRAEVHGSDVLDLAEALIDHDEAFSIWRSRHAYMVERIIGAKPGTGGSSGVSYLRATLNTRFFPELWAMRTQL